jgi:hypothetical protein
MVTYPLKINEEFQFQKKTDSSLENCCWQTILNRIQRNQKFQITTNVSDVWYYTEHGWTVQVKWEIKAPKIVNFDLLIPKDLLFSLQKEIVKKLGDCMLFCLETIFMSPVCNFQFIYTKILERFKNESQFSFFQKFHYCSNCETLTTMNNFYMGVPECSICCSKYRNFEWISRLKMF